MDPLNQRNIQNMIKILIICQYINYLNQIYLAAENNEATSLKPQATSGKEKSLMPEVCRLKPSVFQKTAYRGSTWKSKNITIERNAERQNCTGGGASLRYDSRRNGLYYYRARSYDPIMGRFLQTDPMGYQDSMNLYQAFNMNGINYWDPLGLLSFKWNYLGVYRSLNSTFWKGPITKYIKKKKNERSYRSQAGPHRHEEMTYVKYRVKRDKFDGKYYPRFHFQFSTFIYLRKESQLTHEQRHILIWQLYFLNVLYNLKAEEGIGYDSRGECIRKAEETKELYSYNPEKDEFNWIPGWWPFDSRRLRIFGEALHLLDMYSATKTLNPEAIANAIHNFGNDFKKYKKFDIRNYSTKPYVRMAPPGYKDHIGYKSFEESINFETFEYEEDD